MDTAPADFERERTVMQRRVFSTVAHDLNTPLACIIGSLETLEQMKGKLSAQQCDTLIETALSQAHRLNVLFAAMLEKGTPE